MLHLKSVYAAYGPRQVLRDVSFVVEPGQVVALIGPNGAGKSTALGVIAGLVPLTAGGVSLDGVELDGLPAFARARLGMSYLLQGGRVFPSLSVQANLTLAAHGHTPNRRDHHDHLARSLDLFPALRDRLSRPSSLLSGGERQQLAVAMALLDPHGRLLLLDEPCAGLAPQAAEVVLEGILRACADSSRAILLVEQNVERALAVAERVLILRRGQLFLDKAASTLDVGIVSEAFMGGNRH